MIWTIENTKDKYLVDGMGKSIPAFYFDDETKEVGLFVMNSDGKVLVSNKEPVKTYLIITDAHFRPKQLNQDDNGDIDGNKA